MKIVMTKHFTITVIIYLTVYSSKELLNVYWLDLIGSVVETIHQKIFTGRPVELIQHKVSSKSHFT